MRQLSYTIEPEADGLSVNAYARNIAGLSRAFLRSVKFRENGILINRQRVTTRGVLHAGDSLVFNIPNDRTQKVVPAEGPVSIVFENEDIVLVNKPAGLVIHPCHRSLFGYSAELSGLVLPTVAGTAAALSHRSSG